MDFGVQRIGTERPRAVELTNIGTRSLDVVAEPATDFDAQAFAFDLNPEGRPLEPGQTSFLLVSFTPERLGAAEAGIRIRWSDGALAGTELVTLIGRGVTSEIVVRPDRLSFGNVLVMTESVLEIEVTNLSEFRTEIEFLADSNTAVCGTNDSAASPCGTGRSCHVSSTSISTASPS